MNENKFEEILISMIKDLRGDFKELREELKELHQDVSNIKTDVAWIKGKLEGSQEGKASVWQIVTTATAVGAVIIALIALLK